MIAIRADGNMDIGMGHLMRCMCIAQKLVQVGIKIMFLPSPDTEIEILLRQGFQVTQLKENGVSGWNLKETLDIIQQKKVDLLIVDSYRTSSEDFKALRKYTKVLYLDDLYSYDADVDVIINCNIDADYRMYFNRQIMDRKVFTGVEYFPLRQEFHKYLNNPIKKKITNVLITTGSTDPFCCIYQIINSLSVGYFPHIKFNVLLGKFYLESYVKELKSRFAQEKNVYFVAWGGDIAKTISSCDLVISSGSSTVFEALSIGVPCITFQFAENHNTECVELEKLGIAPWAGIYNSIQDEDTNKHLKELFIKEFDFNTRKIQYNTFSKKFDGKGLQRITEVICKTVNGDATSIGEGDLEENTMKKIMILGASELQLPAIRTAKDMGLQVITLDMNPDSIGFKELGVIHEVISTLDEEKVLEAARRYKIDAITTICADFAMRTVARVAEELGLPGISVKAAYTATNKAALRKRLAECGIPIPRFVKVDNKEEFLEAINTFKGKCVVKAVDNSASRGIEMIDDPQNIEKALKTYDYCVPFSHSGEILIEEFMEGAEVCVETLSVHGKCYPIQISDQLAKEPPFFTDAGYNQPTLLDEETQKKIREVAIATNVAVGNNDGSSCTEIIVTKDGPKVVEIGPRLAGDFMTTHLVPLSCGVDMVKAVINIALGNDVDVERKFSKGSCIRYYMKPTIGKIIAYHGIEDAKNVEGVQDVFIFKKPGEIAKELRASGDRLLAVLAQKETPEEAIACCEEALNMISVEVE